MNYLENKIWFFIGQKRMHDQFQIENKIILSSQQRLKSDKNDLSAFNSNNFALSRRNDKKIRINCLKTFVYGISKNLIEPHHK